MQGRQTNTIVYKDFDLAMRAHPVTGKLFVKKNDDSLIQAIKNLILTNQYERPFRSDFGSSIQDELFENYSSETESSIRYNISTAIENYEPRVELIDIRFVGDPDRNSLGVSIIFRGKNSTNISEANISLDRIR